ncbi:MAG: SDR family NAD(P)-dependent oxidoreductase [Chroococcidiopsidaceae cyanobacterium CP_BM_ER_R8_30]|nr:SDR family NAD(P)-dependent oxidoreductase [Chroococcidiopsidaceae cyanobacterium CP_BM_ER_R8_30]
MNNSKVFSNKTGLEIAIIGMAGRFPKAKNVDGFWQNLLGGVESVSFYTNEELAASGIDQSVLSNPQYVKAGAALEDIEFFDASFFGFNPREAQIMDPQHRLFLECAWEALESAGYNSQTYQGSIGVYAGASLSPYLLNLYANRNVDSIDEFQLGIGNDKDFLTTRVSYKLNLQGPSYTVQTACSTSLVAVHLACQSLLSGECDIALAGGVSITLFKKAGYVYQQGGILSPDGHCRAFDAKAQGTVDGNGVGIVVLKRLEDAITDRDCIHAVIKGSAINNDGSAKVSYTAPRIDSQAKVIKAAQIMAEIEPETITYVETHGTGTSLGDPIEIAALKQAFLRHTEKKGFCAIGSVKTNIGHLDAAAGVAGLIKTVLSLKHKLLPPSLHFEEPNPQIDFANSPFYVNATLSEWKANKSSLRAGVSSFGIGGTNAHVILEEAPAQVEACHSHSRPWQLLVLSAKTSSALESATVNLATHLKQYPALSLADVAHTLQVGRQAFDYRRVLVCQDLNDAVQALEPPNPQRILTNFQEPCDHSVVFMFPGQGAQYVNMGLELYQTEPTFRKWIDFCSEILKPYLRLDLRTVLYPSQGNAEAAAQQLKQTYITQLALFVIEYALAQLWISWGIRPMAMIGHSIGEYVGATLAGVFSLEDALALVTARGQLIQHLPSGAMLSISLPEKQVNHLLGDGLSLAASNSSSLCVVSGTTEATLDLQHRLIEQGIDCRRLHTSHAFHSEMMEPILESFTQQVKKVKLHPPQIPFVSNVTGTWITATEVTDPSYWSKHLRQTVRFAKGIDLVMKEPNRILLEVGPGRTLSTFAKQNQPDELISLTSLCHPQERQSDVAFLLNTLGKLWLAGVQIDWSGFYAHEQRYRIPLPTYPFERQSYWIEPQSDSSVTKQQTLLHKSNIADWFYIPSWKQSRPLEPFQGKKVKAEKPYCLIFADEHGIGKQLAKQLEEQQNVITVIVGERFAKLSDEAYSINPQQPGDYDALLQALQTLGQLPKAIAHLWSITLHEQTDLLNQCFKKSQDLGFYSLLFLAQALGKQNITDSLQIMVVTNNLHDVTGFERLSPEKATVLGPCKVIGQEYPNIVCHSVDVVIPESTIGNKKLIDQLVAEFTTAPTAIVVAYRGNHRWIQTFEPIRVDEAIEEKMRLRKNGVYLITGGLGHIGLVLAKHLAKMVQAKLILIGRSGLPKRDEWEQWIAAHSDQDATSHKLREVKALEDLGAEVLVISADVANPEQMLSAIAQAHERFGDINGVIHAAGIVEENAFSPIQEISKTECELHFHPKAHGLLVLEKVLHGKALDFCLLLSSLGSILGGLGYVAYSAANLFMDAFAHRHNQTDSVPWLSVNWDSWQLGEKAEQNTAIGKTLNELSITPKEGVEVFERVLSMGAVTQAVISTGDLQTRTKQWLKLESLPNTEKSKNGNSHTLHPRANLQNTYVAPHTPVEQTIAKIWEQLLGIERVGIHDNFFELGGHSLLATQVISRLREAFSIELSLQSLFNEPTVAGMATVAEKIQWTTQKLQTNSSNTLGEREEIEF